MERLQKVVGHLRAETKMPMASSNPTSAFAKKDDDVVIVSALRTPIGRAKKGSFKDLHPTDLLAAALKGVMDQTGLKHALVGDIVVGNVSGTAFATHARMGQFLADFPETVPINTCNRQCSSGLQAVANVAASIRNGYYECGIAAGVEHMSSSNMMDIGELNDRVFDNELASACLNQMGVTSENVAEKFGITRAQQDGMAVESHKRALAAQAQGLFKDEIIPVTCMIEDKNGDEKEVTVSQDDGPRAGTTLARLAKLRTVFKENGTTTAGNASQVSDGASAVILMTRRLANKLRLPVLGAFRGFAVSGCRPEIMGIGPALAIPALCRQTGVDIKDIDAFELNEAFASQATYCVQKLGLDMAKVNPVGGAIALGHPLGMTGNRQVATLLHHLRREKKELGVVSMCIGTGMGAAALFSAE